MVALEAAIDAAEHLIASEGLRASTSFADTFAVLGESGHLDGTLSEAMQDAARFRNLLVHGYADVDDERVVGILKTRLGDLERFRRVWQPSSAPTTDGVARLGASGLRGRALGRELW